jgi:two-component system chemotaxis response regulator CheB
MTTDTRRPAVELVVLLASAGGLDALSIVLRDLPTEFPAAVVVQQHLGGVSSVLPTILGRQTRHRVGWAQDGQALARGEVVVCPPGMHLELTPDARCRLRKMQSLAEQRFDVLLASVARSYGARSVAVVLSGSGRDGAVGTVAMKGAGAIVIAQSPDTARYPSMPIAAARAGADLVLPISEIGRLLADIVAGAPLPKPRPREKGWAAGWIALPLRALAQCPGERSPGDRSPGDRSLGEKCPERNGDTATPVEGDPVDRDPVAGDAVARDAVAGESMDTDDVTTARHDGHTQPSPNHAANSAAARAEMARLRAAELQRRRQDLSAGFGSTARTVALAQHRAAESLRRAQLAHQAAEQAATRWSH